MSNAVGTESAFVGIDVAACFVSDPTRSIAFYCDVLGMMPTRIDDAGRGAEFTRAAATYRERGLVLSDIHETPACSMAFGEDPDGNTLIVHQRKVE